MDPEVIPWTIRLRRESDFWQEEISVTDKDSGAPITFTDTELTITPDEGGTPIVWNPSNGKLTIPSAGVFAFNVLRSAIATYLFDSGHYCWSVTYSNGKVDGSWMTGPVRITGCP